MYWGILCHTRNAVKFDNTLPGCCLQKLDLTSVGRVLWRFSEFHMLCLAAAAVLMLHGEPHRQLLHLLSVSRTVWLPQSIMPVNTKAKKVKEQLLLLHQYVLLAARELTEQCTLRCTAAAPAFMHQ